MPSSPFDGFKTNIKMASKQMNLMAKIAKCKVDIAQQKGEKERHLKTIGVKIHAIFSKDRNVEGNVVADEISNELNLIERIDKHVEELQAEIENLKGQFRETGGKDYVDATEVREAIDDQGKKD